MKRYLAAFLAIVLVASQLGGYIPASAAEARYVLDAAELKGNTQTAFTAEETTLDGVSVSKMTPDGTTNSVISIDNWTVLDGQISEKDYPYVAVDYYYDVQEGSGGSWKNWTIGSSYIDDKAESDAETLNQGPAVVEYDANLAGPKYIAKLTGTSSNSTAHIWKEIWQTISGVSAGETYVFSCDYYVPDGGLGGIRIYNGSRQNAVWANTAGNKAARLAGGANSSLNDAGGSRGTLAVEYTVQSGETYFEPTFIQESGEGYYWNFCVTKKATAKGLNNYKNLLKNADFTESNGSWIGWKTGLGNVTDKTGSDKVTQTYGPTVVAYDANIVGRLEPAYMAKLIGKYTNSNQVTHTWKDVQQVIRGVKEGETYVFSCKYYMPAGSRGNIRFYAENVSGTAIWTARGLAGNTTTERGTMIVEYTVPANCTWIAPTMVQEETGLGYYWDLCVTKKGGDGTNLLQNADFAVDQPTIAENMTIRMLPDRNSNEYRNSENKIVTNQWARVIFDLSDWADKYGDLTDGLYRQMHFFPWGKTDDSKGTTADGTMYINNIAFYKEKPGTPTVTDVSFITNELRVVRNGNVRIPTVTVEGEHYPITAYDMVLSGHSSANTYISDGCLFVGADETAETITITATSVMNTGKSASCTVHVKDAITRSTFDEDNITTRFGVVSDTHLSGSWNQPRSIAKFAHTIDALQKTAEKDNAKLDALLVNGDLVDAVASFGNVNAETDTYGSKAVQNFREVNYVAQGLWGAPTNGTETDLTDTTTGYGVGIDDGVKFFYSLGNHDETGKGEASSTKYDKVYSAEYFAAIICGWQYDISKDRADYATAAWDESYVDYINDLIDYNTNDATTVTPEGFLSKYGVKLATADAKFDKYYGFDTNYSNEDGLLYGNRHMTIGEGNDAIHFVALELSISQASLNYLEEICTRSVKENANKPIFVITHYKVSEDMPGYESVQNQVREVMAKYPQIIVWGGHSHSYLHSDRAIDSDEGFIQVDSSATAYASQSFLTFGASKGAATTNSAYADNAANKENHAFSMGCYVEVDKNFNVRINRIDLYRSFSAEYEKDTTLYSHDIFTKYEEKATADPVDKAVFIRESWDITDIGLEGIHLADYTNKRIENTAKPAFTNAAKIDVKCRSTALTADITLDATDDGMVYMYVVELWDTAAGSLVERHYYTNKFYDYPDISKIPAVQAKLKFENLEQGKEYEVKAYPVDEYDVAGDAISVKAVPSVESDALDNPIPSGDPEYMAKLIGTYTDSNGVKQTWKEVSQKVAVTGGKTYEFSFNYYVPGKGAVSGRLMDRNWKVIEGKASVAGEIGTIKLTYTATDEDEWVVPLISKNEQGIAYVWNLCFNEVGGSVNLLENGDISEEDGSWINWNVGGTDVTDKAGSNKVAKAYGHDVVKFDKTLFKVDKEIQIPSGDPKYMAKLIGTYTDSNGAKQTWKEVSQRVAVTEGKTYEFSFNYYVPGKGALSGRLMDRDWKVIESKASATGEIGTIKITYTAKAGDEWVTPLISKNEKGIAYVWNLSFNQVGGQVNLLKNGSFAEEDGSWISWNVGGMEATNKAGSNKVTKAFGHEIIKFDKSLFVLDEDIKVPSGDPEYMLKLIGTYIDSNGEKQTWKEVSQKVTVTEGKTYEFSFNYFVPGQGAVTCRLMDRDWKILTYETSQTGQIGTAKVSYTAKAGDEWVTPLISKNEQGIAYVWNLSFNEVGGKINLLKNGDFAEEDGTLISWNVGGMVANDKAGSEKVTKAFGHEVVKFNKKLFTLDEAIRIPSGDPKYMAKLIGTYTDSNGDKQTWKEVHQRVNVTPGKKYEFSFSYFVPGQGSVMIRLMDRDWNILESDVSETGEIGVLKLTYTAKEGDEWVTPLISKNEDGIAYVWNACFNEVGGKINLLKNANFAEEKGTWIGWTVGGKTAEDKAGSNKVVAAFGHEIIKFDRKLFEREKGNASAWNSAINPNYYFSFDENGKYKDLDTWVRSLQEALAGNGIDNGRTLLVVGISGVTLGLMAVLILLIIKNNRRKHE